MCLCVLEFLLCVHVFTAERRIAKVKWNRDCILTPKLQRHRSSIAAVKSKVCQSPEMLRNEKHNEFYWKSKRASPQLMSHPFCVAMAAWRWAIITVHPQRAGHDGEIWAVSAAPESMTPECKQQAGAEDGAPTTARKPLLGGPQKESAVWAFIEQWATSMCNMPIKVETYNKLKKLIYWRCECACEYPSFNCRYNTHTQHPVSPNPKETEEILKDVDWGRKKKDFLCMRRGFFCCIGGVLSREAKKDV